MTAMRCTHHEHFNDPEGIKRDFPVPSDPRGGVGISGPAPEWWACLKFASGDMGGSMGICRSSSVLTRLGLWTSLRFSSKRFLMMC